MLNRLLTGEDLSRWDISYYIQPEWLRSGPSCFEVGYCSSSDSECHEIESAHDVLCRADNKGSDGKGDGLAKLRIPDWLSNSVVMA